MGILKQKSCSNQSEFNTRLAECKITLLKRDYPELKDLVTLEGFTQNGMETSAYNGVLDYYKQRLDKYLKELENTLCGSAHAFFKKNIYFSGKNFHDKAFKELLAYIQLKSVGYLCSQLELNEDSEQSED